jgi:hypothetical protein
VETLSWLGLALVLLVAAGVVFWLIGRTADPARRLVKARAEFDAHRPQLETEFFHAASASGKPRGLLWIACDWSEAIAFARDKETHQIVALRGVTIQFEAIAGSDMEGLPAVGNLRNASAVFILHQGRWRTQGKAVFNLNPDEALRHFAAQYEALADDHSATL